MSESNDTESPTADAAGGDQVAHRIHEAVERITVAARVADVQVVVAEAANAEAASVEAATDAGAQATLVFLADDEKGGGSFADRFSVEHEGGHLGVEEAEGDWSRGTLRIALAQPSAAVRIRARAGAVAVSGLEGNLAVRSRNGAINAERCTGNLKLMCANGSIEVAQCSAAHVELASSNGRITMADTELGGGTVKTANGRIRLQLRPRAAGGDPGVAGREDGGRLTVYSANGGISLAVPEETSTLFKVRSLGRVRNDLPVQSVQSSAGMTVLKTGSGEPQGQPFVVLIKNLKGRIELMRYVHFDPSAEERRSDDLDGDDEFFEEGQPHGVWFDVDFSEELPKFMHDAKRFGAKFGNLGEEISREMRHAFAFGRRQHHGPREQARRQTRDTSAEVASVLEMLKEGKITVEEAETLIAAIRR